MSFKLTEWLASHYDLGAIRTEALAGRPPPEKKERYGSQGTKKRLEKNQGAAVYLYWLFKSTGTSQLDPETFKYRICVSKFNIDSGGGVCQVSRPKVAQ